MKPKFLLEVNGLTVKEAGAYLLKDISFKIKKGECWAINGSSGSGKSTLLRCLQQFRSYSENIRFGENTSPKIEWIRHHHSFKNLAGVNNFYYQQRFNSSESEDSKTVIQDILKEGGYYEEAIGFLKLLQIEYLEDIPLIKLSNGEHKRFQVAKALFEKAEWLLLDNPFTGLDTNARILFRQILENILKSGIHIILIAGNEIPEFITHVAVLQNGILTGVYNRKKFSKGRSVPKATEKIEWKLPSTFTKASEDNFRFAVRMENVHVHYNGRAILEGINWKVKNGESWCISGPNGSGKSTLLSLINGDNPHAFANDIYLFDRKRGTGETIWEIKKKIGYISPELHQHFDKSSSCFNVVASGLFDTIGLFRKLKDDQIKIVNDCLEAFHIKEFSEKPLSALSNGLQRWTLLARAIVKNPPLLIFDEPCQGLDDELCDQFTSFIEWISKKSSKTLIYVTHVPEEIPDCVTHFLKLEKGKIIEIKENGKEYHSDSGRRDRA